MDNDNLGPEAQKDDLARVADDVQPADDETRPDPTNYETSLSFLAAGVRDQDDLERAIGRQVRIGPFICLRTFTHLYSRPTKCLWNKPTNETISGLRKPRRVDRDVKLN
jgi:hypothetical protein